MPQANGELRNEWHDDATAARFLEAAGYTLRPDWIWEWPKPFRPATPKEIRAVTYLIDEWDFGGLDDSQPEPVA